MTSIKQEIAIGGTSGWGFPGASRKAHYFVEITSLCRKWMYSGTLIDTGDKSPDDCAECTKRLAKLKGKRASLEGRKGSSEA